MNVPQSIEPTAARAIAVDPIAELLAAADSWERRRSRVPRSVTIEAEARLAAAVVAMRRSATEAVHEGPCTRCGGSAESGPCKGVRKVGA